MVRVNGHEQAGPEPKPTAWYWRSLNWFFNSAMCAAIFGAIAVTVILTVAHSRNQPPDISTVSNLMKEEVTAAETRNTTLVNRIYTSDAVVTDAACQTPRLSQTWQGYAQIDARYRNPGKFLWLQHVFAQVTWDPNDRGASTAYVTADTAGVLLPATSHGKPQSIVGHELWIFVRANGQWRIASFTYNLCFAFPASPGA